MTERERDNDSNGEKRARENGRLIESARDGVREWERVRKRETEEERDRG
jgi:hypothetical protein